MTDDAVYTIDVTTGNSIDQVSRLAQSFDLLADKIEAVTQAFAGQRKRTGGGVGDDSGPAAANPQFNRVLQERINLLRELSVVTKILSGGSPGAAVNRARLQGRSVDQDFTGAGLSAREIRQAQKQAQDFRTASASAEALAASRRRTDLKAVTDAGKADLAIQAQILKIVRQKGDIETKGATKARQATLERYQDELRQIVNIQTHLRRRDDAARRDRSTVTGDIAAFRSRIARMNLLDAATRKSAQDQIAQFKQVAEAAGLYYGRTEATIRNVENHLNNQIRRQGRGVRLDQAIEAASGEAKEAETSSLKAKEAAVRLLDLQIRQQRDRLRNEEMTTAEMREQVKVLNGLVDARRKANLKVVRDPETLAEKTKTASLGRNDMVFGSGAHDFFKFQGGLMLNYALLSQAQQGVTALLGSVVSLDEALHDLQAITGSNDEQMGRLGEAVLDVSTRTKFLATETAEGAKVLAQAGLSVDQIKGALGGVALFASATGTSFKDSADLMTSTLSVFNMRAGESLNLANLFTAALNQTKLTSEQLGLAIQYVANTAAQANIPIEELVADVGSLANAGIRSGSTIGTGLRALLIDLMNPTQKLQAEMKRLGLTFADIDVQTRGLNPVIQTLTDKGFGVSEAFRSMETRAAAAFVALQGQRDGYGDLLSSITGTNAAVDANQKQMEALANTARNTVSVFTALASKAFSPVVVVLRKTLAAVNDLAGGLQGLEPVLGVIGVAAAAVGTAFGVSLLVRVLKLGAALAGMRAWFSLAGTAMVEMATGATTLGAALEVLVGPAGWIALAAVGVMGLVSWLGSMKSAAEEAAEAVEHSQASLASAKARYDDNQKAVKNLGEEIDRMSRQEKTLRGDKEALGATVARLNEHFGDLGLSIDGTADTFDKVLKRTQDFRKELQGQTLDAIRETRAELHNLHNAQQKQLAIANPLLQGLEDGFLERTFFDTRHNPFMGIDKAQKHVFGKTVRNNVLTNKIEAFAAAGMPADVVQALRDSMGFREGMPIEEQQAALNTTTTARRALNAFRSDDAKVARMADALGMSVEDLVEGIGSLFGALKAHIGKIEGDIETQKHDLAAAAAERITKMSENQLGPAYWLGQSAKGIHSTFQDLKSSAPMDAIDGNRYLQEKGGGLLNLGMKAVSGLAGMIGPEFKAAVDKAAGGTLTEMQAEIDKDLGDRAVHALEEWKTFLPEALKASEAMVRMSQGGVQRALGTGGFDEALGAYLESLHLALGTMTKDFVARELDRDPSGVGFDMKSSTPTGIGALSDQQTKQLSVFMAGQVTDFMTRSAEAIGAELKSKAADAYSQDEILELNKQLSKAIDAVVMPRMKALQADRDSTSDPTTQGQIDSALAGLRTARDTMIQSYTKTTTEALTAFNDKASEAGQKVFESLTSGISGLPTQVMSKAERGKWAETFRNILNEKKAALLKEFLDLLTAMPGMVQQNGFIKTLSPKGEALFDFKDRALTAQIKDQMNNFQNPKTAKYGDSAGLNAKLLKPWEQWKDRQAEIDRGYDSSTRDIHDPSRRLDTALGADDVTRSYSDVERKALETQARQRKAAELPLTIRAETTRRGRLQQLLGDFNKVNGDRLGDLKKTYDDPKFSNEKRNGALSEYNKILDERRDIEDRLTSSTNALADAQEAYNVSTGKGAGSDLSLGQQLSLSVDQMVEQAGLLGSLTDQIGNQIPATLDTVRGSFAGFIESTVSGTKSVGDAFRDMAKSIISSMLKIASEKAAASILGSILGSFGFGGGASGVTNLPKGMSEGEFYTDPAGGGGGMFSGIGKFFGFNGGGVVRAAQGAGPTTRDAVPVLAREGEFILRNSAVSAIGADNLRAINAMGNNLIAQAAPPAFEPQQPQGGGVVNVYVVAPDQKPGLGPNDIVAAITDDIARGGTTKKLIKQVTMGTI